MSTEQTVKKVCIFCGEKPASKTMEHILPQWLLKFTGDPNREAFLGIDLGHYFKTKEVKERRFAFSAFKFPACYSCNNDFASLEAEAQQVVFKIFNNEYLNNLEITILLDWMDKVRTGLWLAFSRLDDYADDLAPKFYIAKRRALKDRTLFIYDFKEQKQNLAIIGINSPIFTIMPSCFSLVINNKLFFSASTMHLVAESVGFPYGKLVGIDDNYNQIYDSKAGKNKLTYPIVKFPYASGGVELYQAVYAKDALISSERSWDTDYNSDYVKNNIIDISDFDRKLSKVFYKEGKRLEVLQDEDELDVRPTIARNEREMYGIIKRMTNAGQTALWKSQIPKSHLLTQKQREEIIESDKAMFKAQDAVFGVGR